MQRIIDIIKAETKALEKKQAYIKKSDEFKAIQKILDEYQEGIEWIQFLQSKEKIVVIYEMEELTMDKQINKVKKDLKKGEKDTKKLLKMDKVQDKKLDRCDKMSCSAKMPSKGMAKKK